MPEPAVTEAQGEDGGGEGVPPAKTVPVGIVPLFFSGASQQVFGCVTDTDLTSENPHVLIPKEKILEDFKNRAAVSDFHPVKKQIQASEWAACMQEVVLISAHHLQ